MAIMFGDITGLQQGHHPWVYLILSREDQRLSTGSQIVSKYCSILKTWWTGVPSTPPPLNHDGGMTFSCTSEGIKSSQRVWETSRWKNVSKAWAYAAKSHSTSTREYIGAKTVMLVPFQINPASLQVHLKDPTVLTQLASASQLCSSVSHSLISAIKQQWMI